MLNRKLNLPCISCPLPFKFRVRLLHHLRRYLVAHAATACLAVIFQQNFAFGINASKSLPNTLYLIHKGAAIHRGDYVAFRWHGGGPYPAGVTFIKIAAGVPGDRVARKDRDYYVNGSFVGTAKTHARDGKALVPMHDGVLGADEYYVSAPHPDSLDSRYRLTGWIPRNDFIGRAHAIF